jgi:hypothetical protein
MATTVVNWDGDYVSANQNLQRSSSFVVADYDADGADDSVRRQAFSDATALSPAANYTTTSGNSGRFYGGMDFWRIDATASFSTNNFAVQNANASDGGDTIAFGQTNGSNRRQFGAVVWNQADFLDAVAAGGATTRSFDASSSVTLDVTTNQSNHSTWRILVRNNGQYYVSSFNATGDATVNGATLGSTTWAAYNPATDLRPVPGTDVGAAGLSYGTSTSALTDIEGVGFYVESVDSNAVGDRIFRVEAFNASIATGAAAPAAPSGLAAAAAGSTSINLTWVDNSSDETGFEIDRSTSSTFASGVATVTVGANATSYASTGLTASTTYYYRVRAVNAGGLSGNSNTASATTQAAVTPPAAPSGLSAAAASSSQVNLTWTDNSSNETGFAVDYSTSSTFASGVTTLSAAANATGLSVMGLTGSTTYYFRVRATNGAGASSDSNTASATTQAPTAGAPAAPSGLYVTPLSSTILQLSWLDNASDETGFKVERATNANGPWAQVNAPGVDSESYRNTGLTAGTTYFYRVRSTNAAGDSAYSNVASATTTAASAEVIKNDRDADVVRTGLWDNGYINTSTGWAGNYYYDRDTVANSATATFPVSFPSAGRYDVYYWAPKRTAGTAASAVPVDITHAVGTTRAYIDTTDAYSEQWILIGAYNFNATGGSAVVRDTTGSIAALADAFRFVLSPTAAPAAPTSLTATAVGPGRVTLNWSANATNESNYLIERSPDGTSWTQIAAAPTNANRFVVTSLNASTQYYFRVRATNSAGNSAYSNTATATTANALHRRLWITPAQVTALKSAIMVAGSHHKAAFDAMKARVDQNNWQIYDENTADGNWNYARGWLAREAAMMYLLTDNASYATIAYNALESMYTNPDPDNRLPDGGYNDNSNTDLSRASTGLAYAVVYDWAYAGMTQPQRDFVRSKLSSALDAWPGIGVPNDSGLRVSNHVGASRSAELIMMLSVNEEESRSARYGFLKNRIRDHINGAYGSSGWTQEGTGYADFAGMFMVPAILAMRSVGDTSLDSTFNAKAFYRLPMAAYSGLQNATTKQLLVLQSGVDSGSPLNQEGWMSALLGTVPSSELPYYRWFYDKTIGITSPLSAANKFDLNRAGTTWALAFYPTTGSSADPDTATTNYRTLADDGEGMYYFRNRFQDTDDVMVSAAADIATAPNAWNVAEAFQFNLIAYGQKFVGGPGKDATSATPAHAKFTGLLVDGLAQANVSHTGTLIFDEQYANGGGYLIAGGGTKYSNLGLTSAARHTLVDFDGDAAPAVLSTLDRVTDESTHTYTWQLALGDEASNLGITVTSGVEAGRPYFVLNGANGSYVKGWVLSHAAATITAPAANTNDPLKVDVSAGNVDLWVAMVVGQGTPPVASISGTGLSTVLTVNGGRVRYDAGADRIVSEATTPARPISREVVLPRGAGFNLQPVRLFSSSVLQPDTADVLTTSASEVL